MFIHEQIPSMKMKEFYQLFYIMGFSDATHEVAWVQMISELYLLCWWMILLCAGTQLELTNYHKVQPNSTESNINIPQPKSFCDSTLHVIKQFNLVLAEISIRISPVQNATFIKQKLHVSYYLKWILTLPDKTISLVIC